MGWDMMDEACMDTGIDLDYEFDAPRFYDFTCDETEVEAREAEAWFGTAPEHPPSPVVKKWNWNPSVHVEAGQCNDSTKGAETWNVGPNSPRTASHRFMNPTASHLAKQCDSKEILLCDRLLRRFERLSFRAEKKKSLRHSLNDTRATKRQKLEVGYLPKGALMDSKSAASKLKVTVPREPNLVTAQRAVRRRSKMSRESTESNRSSLHKFTERPRNQKNVDAPSSPLPKVKIGSPRSQGQEFQAVDNLNAGSDSRNNNSSPTRLISPPATQDSALKESRGLNEVGDGCISNKENYCRTDKFHGEPPWESLSKISLASETSSTKPFRLMKENSKCLKENAPAYCSPKHKPAKMSKASNPTLRMQDTWEDSSIAVQNVDRRAATELLRSPFVMPFVLQRSW